MSCCSIILSVIFPILSFSNVCDLRLDILFFKRFAHSVLRFNGGDLSRIRLNVLKTLKQLPEKLVLTMR